MYRNLRVTNEQIEKKKNLNVIKEKNAVQVFSPHLSGSSQNKLKCKFCTVYNASPIVMTSQMVPKLCTGAFPISLWSVTRQKGLATRYRKKKFF